VALAYRNVLSRPSGPFDILHGLAGSLVLFPGFFAVRYDPQMSLPPYGRICGVAIGFYAVAFFLVFWAIRKVLDWAGPHARRSAPVDASRYLR
jgi:drug/metabolite transporter (DMT)-like permease